MLQFFVLFLTFQTQFLALFLQLASLIFIVDVQFFGKILFDLFDSFEKGGREFFDTGVSLFFENLYLFVTGVVALDDDA